MHTFENQEPHHNQVTCLGVIPEGYSLCTGYCYILLKIWKQKNPHRSLLFLIIKSKGFKFSYTFSGIHPYGGNGINFLGLYLTIYIFIHVPFE